MSKNFQYYYRRDDVTSFGIWQNYQFKVFVEKTVDKMELRDDLTKLDQDFSMKYRLDIEERTLLKKLTLKQGDGIQQKEGGDDVKGTLGGFVTRTDQPSKIYGLTCNHIFPIENLPAYSANCSQPNQIGTCVFTTRDMSSDFAAIEMDEVIDCDVCLRSEDEKRTNARLYDGNMQEIGVVHKIGARSGPTTGFILSSEFYDKITDIESRDFIFLVGVEDGDVFSKKGDSGSLVFSRQFELGKKYIGVVGMVFGIYNNEDDRLEEEEGNAIGGTSNETKSASAIPRHISCCYRIRPSLELFERYKNMSVKFKDDYSSSDDSS